MGVGRYIFALAAPLAGGALLVAIASLFNAAGWLFRRARRNTERGGDELLVFLCLGFGYNRIALVLVGVL